MSEQIQIIEAGFDKSGKMDSTQEQQLLLDAVQEAISMLDSGEARVAEKIAGEWHVNQWLKKAVLLSFRLADNEVIPGTHSRFYDNRQVRSGFPRRCRSTRFQYLE